MQDFLLTLVIIFVLFRIFGRSRSTPKSTVHFTQNNFQSAPKKTAGEVSVDYIPEQKESKSNDKEKGDYIDYEEVK